MKTIALFCLTLLAVTAATSAQADCPAPCGATLCPRGGMRGAVDASAIDRNRSTFKVDRAFGSPPAGFGEGSEFRVEDQTWRYSIPPTDRILILFPQSGVESPYVLGAESSGDLYGACEIPMTEAVAVSLSSDCVGAASKKGLFPECHDTMGCTAGAGSATLLTLALGFAAIALGRRFGSSATRRDE